jgi:hypothetical protein
MEKECNNKIVRAPTFLGWAALLLFISLEVLRAKWKVCLPDADCESYLHMVWYWGAHSEVLSHHAMRILPSMLVYAGTVIGLTPTFGFWLLSMGAFVSFTVAIFKTIDAVKPGHILAIGFTLLLLSAHWAMTYGLSNVYQATDALTYPLGLLLFWQLRKQQGNALLVTGILSCAVRQSLFVMAFAALLQLATERPNLQACLRVVLLCIAYTALTRFYGASGTLLAHIIPDWSFFSISLILERWSESHLTWLLLPVIPMLLTYPRAFYRFFARYPALFVYGVIVVAQPFIAFEMTGQANFVRIAMQGIWPLYLCAAFAVIESSPSKAEQWIWFSYALLMASTYSHSLRGIVVPVALILVFILKYKEHYVRQSA